MRVPFFPNSIIIINLLALFQLTGKKNFTSLFISKTHKPLCKFKHDLRFFSVTGLFFDHFPIGLLVFFLLSGDSSDNAHYRIFPGPLMPAGDTTGLLQASELGQLLLPTPLRSRWFVL